MLIKEYLAENKNNINNLAGDVSDGDIGLLVDWLNEKDDDIRYSAFLLLQNISERDSRVYKYWDRLAEKIKSENSYQRSIGLMLIAQNIVWDDENRFESICHEYLKHCDDEKFITSRQCIQGLKNIIEHKEKYNNEVISTLTAIDLQKRKDTQRGLLLLDITEILERIYKKQADTKIAEYLEMNFQFGNDKAKKAIQRILAQRNA
jgi:Transcription termination factor